MLRDVSPKLELWTPQICAHLCTCTHSHTSIYTNNHAYKNNNSFLFCLCYNYFVGKQWEMPIAPVSLPLPCKSFIVFIHGHIPI